MGNQSSFDATKDIAELLHKQNSVLKDIENQKRATLEESHKKSKQIQSLSQQNKILETQVQNQNQKLTEYKEKIQSLQEESSKIKTAYDGFSQTFKGLHQNQLRAMQALRLDFESLKTEIKNTFHAEMHNSKNEILKLLKDMYHQTQHANQNTQNHLQNLNHNTIKLTDSHQRMSATVVDRIHTLKDQIYQQISEKISHHKLETSTELDSKMSNVLNTLKTSLGQLQHLESVLSAKISEQVQKIPQIAVHLESELNAGIEDLRKTFYRFESALTSFDNKNEKHENTMLTLTEALQGSQGKLEEKILYLQDLVRFQTMASNKNLAENSDKLKTHQNLINQIKGQLVEIPRLIEQTQALEMIAKQTNSEVSQIKKTTHENKLVENLPKLIREKAIELTRIQERIENTEETEHKKRLKSLEGILSIQLQTLQKIKNKKEVSEESNLSHPHESSSQL